LRPGRRTPAWVRGRREYRRPSHLSASERSSHTARPLRGRPRDCSGRPARQHPDPKSRFEMKNQPKIDGTRRVKRLKGRGTAIELVHPTGSWLPKLESRSLAKASWLHAEPRTEASKSTVEVGTPSIQSSNFLLSPRGSIESFELLAGRIGFEILFFRTEASPGSSSRIIAGGSDRRRGAKDRRERSLLRILTLGIGVAVLGRGSRPKAANTRRDGWRNRECSRRKYGR
jgi:hypothetical protein